MAANSYYQQGPPQQDTRGYAPQQVSRRRQCARNPISDVDRLAGRATTVLHRYVLSYCQDSGTRELSASPGPAPRTRLRSWLIGRHRASTGRRRDNTARHRASTARRKDSTAAASSPMATPASSNLSRCASSSPRLRAARPKCAQVYVQQPQKGGGGAGAGCVPRQLTVRPVADDEQDRMLRLSRRCLLVRRLMILPGNATDKLVIGAAAQKCARVFCFQAHRSRPRQEALCDCLLVRSSRSHWIGVKR